MRNKYYSYSFYIFGFFLIFYILISGCKKEFALKDTKDAENLLNTVYPKKIECDYDLVIRYESKDGPENWSEFQWKKDNNYLEKTGLLKQVIIDTTIEIYERSHAKFVDKHQYLYKIIMSQNLKSLIIDSQLRNRKFDEYDYDNRKTGKLTWLNCKVVYGYLNVDTILKIEQKDPPYTSVIRYCEKFAPTEFNEIASKSEKYYKGEIINQSIEAKKYSGEECRLVY